MSPLNCANKHFLVNSSNHVFSDPLSYEENKSSEISNN